MSGFATAQTWIASLNRFLDRRGQDVILTRIPNSVTIRAHIRDYTPDEIATSSAGLMQGDTHFITSGTELAPLAAWPHVPTDPRDALLPLKGDKLTVAGVPRNIQSVFPIYEGDTLVRVNGLLRG